jgi:hypothetical protein
MAHMFECVDLGDEIPEARYFRLWKIQILSFKEIQQNYQSVVYDLFYLCVIY